MNSGWLLEGPFWLRLLALAAVLLPALFILFSRRSRWWAKLIWVTATQAAWGFLLLYVWVWQQRYASSGTVSDLPPLHEALGWWMLAFPWAVYLLYRATRDWFPGERRIDRS